MSIYLYIHIPYCLSKCRYCDFYSKGGSHSVPSEYISAVLRELGAFFATHPSETAASVYFGGGTPSLLEARQAQSILAAIPLQKDAEITLEANPDTLTIAALQGYRSAGINRLSIGIQSANDAALVRLGRTHTASTARTALEAAAKAGFSNISGDIMLSLPFYSFGEIDDTLSLLQDGGCQHISAYMLAIEPNTAFCRHEPEGLPNADEAAEYYLYAVDALAKRGYEQYEISNFAQKGYESRHNMAYWLGRDYLGIGPAAHSCIGGERFYYKADTSGFIHGAQPIQDGKYTAGDYIMLRLRLASGLNIDKLAAEYGICWGKEKLEFIHTLEAHGMAALSGNTLTLTPSGMLIQNSILCELI